MKYIVGLLVVAMIALGVFTFTRQSPDVQNVGAVTGPDSSFACETHNGIQSCFSRFALRTATTTPCSIKSPTATSTLVRSELKLTTASSTATIWTAAKATTAFATTTLITKFSVGSAALATLVATTTSTAGSGASGVNDDITTFAPNTYLVWSMAGVDNVTGTTKLNGVCQATFEAI